MSKMKIIFDSTKTKDGYSMDQLLKIIAKNIAVYGGDIFYGYDKAIDEIKEIVKNKDEQYIVFQELDLIVDTAKKDLENIDDSYPVQKLTNEYFKILKLYK